MGRPDFIGVGTERAGTSWVFSMLAHHPDIWVPPLKEIHYFDEIDPDVPTQKPRFGFHLKSRMKHKFVPFFNMTHRPEFFKNNWWAYLAWDIAYFIGKQNDQWYQNLFPSRLVKGRICGEYTPAYCNISQDIMARMKDMNPDMKFLLMLRHPVSQIRSSLIQNFVMIEGRDFNTVSAQEMEEWLNSPFANLKANLTEILNRWQECVDEEHLFIGLYEEISTAPQEFIARLYEFLGVNHDFLPDQKFYKKKINNLTKSTYVIPEEIENMMKEKFLIEAEGFKNQYPHLAKFWS